MATLKSAKDYITDDKQVISEDAKSVTDSVSSGASQDIVAQGEELSKNWSIVGASNEKIGKISTGSGNDVINFTSSIGGASVNVGTGNDSVLTKDFINTSLVGGDGNKTVGISGDLDPSFISLSGSSVAGTGNDSISVGGAVADSTILSGAGRDSIYIGNTATAGSGNVTSSIINAGADNDIVTIFGSVDSSVIDLGDGRDSMSVTGIVKDSTIDGGAGADVITLTGGASNSKISLGAGKDTLEVTAAIIDTSIYGGADADEISLNGATHSYVDLGDGADVISLKGNYSDFSIAGGNGKDTYTFDATATGGTVTITDYNVNEDLIDDVAPVASVVGADGNVTLTGGLVVNVGKTGEYHAVQTNGGYTAWGDEDGSTIDLNTIGWNKATTIYGSANGNAADMIIGGKKADSIIVGANDSVNGGLGNDTIEITTNTTQEYVGLATGNGTDVVTGFTTTTTGGVESDEADVLYLYENHISSLKLDTVTGGIGAKVGTGAVSLGGGLATGVHEELNVKDNTGKTYEVDFVIGTESISGSTDELADIYYAGTSAAALDFNGVDSALVVDLGDRNLNFNGSTLANTDGAYYYGSFSSVVGGSDNTVLMGAADVKETLVAGTGDATLWGGGSKADSLGHGAGTSNTVTFVFGDGDGKDSISGNWGNSDTSDVLWLGSSATKAIKNDGTNTTITVNDGSKVTLTGVGSTMTDTVVKFTTDNVNIQQAKIGVAGVSNTWTYDADVDFYIGGSKNTLNVTNSVDDALVWADGNNKFENVTTIDARTNSGSVTVAGGALNETIYAGSGDSSIWGGSAGNDVLVGNSAGNTAFYFGNGNGSDVITSSNSDDKVVLYNVTLGDIAGIDTASTGSMEIKLNDGSSLTVSNVATGVSNFELGDGSAYSYDASSGNWTRTK